MREIRKAEERSRLLTVVTGTVVIVGSFVVGYVMGGNTSPTGYPYSAATAAPLVTARRWKQRLLVGVLVAILAFFSFSIGAAINSPSSFGTGTYYGVCSRKV